MSGISCLKPQASGLKLALAVALAALALGLGPRPAAAAGGEESAAPGGGLSTRRGLFVDLDETERRLGLILDYLEEFSGYNLVPKTSEVENLPVTIQVSNMYWHAALQVIARKYQLVLDENIKDRYIIIEKPPLVRMDFAGEEIRSAIAQLAEQANVNIVVDPEITGRVTLRLRNMPWQQALQVLLRTYGYVMVPLEGDVYLITKPEKIKQQTETRIFPLSYIQPAGASYVPKPRGMDDYLTKTKEAATTGSAASQPGGGGAGTNQSGPVKVSGGAEDSLLNVIFKMLSESGSLAYEKRTNSIIVTDTPAKLDDIARVIEKIDVPPKQVHLQIRMVELSDNDYEEIGMAWGTDTTGLSASISGFSSGTLFPLLSSRSFSNQNSILGSLGSIPSATGGLVAADNPSATVTGGNISLGLLNFKSLSAALNLIRTQTKGKIVQSPTITTLSTEEATIFVGELVRYAEQQVSSSTSTTATAWAEASNSPLQLGIQILVVPYVTGPANDVILTLVIKSESFTNADENSHFKEFGDANLLLPQTTQTVVVTKMLLRNGETGVIAGMRSETTGRTTRKIPLLGDIPLLGRLFRSDSSSARAKNLLVFVTPSVVDFEARQTLEAALAAAAAEREERFRVYKLEDERFVLSEEAAQSESRPGDRHRGEKITDNSGGGLAPPIPE